MVPTKNPRVPIQQDGDKLIIGDQTIFFKSSTSMNELSDESIDIIITSPPYNRKKKYADEYNDNLPENEYYQLLGNVFSECFRVLKKNCLFFLNIGDAANDQGKSEHVAQIAEKSGFTRIQTIIWVKSFLGKGHYTPSGGNRRLNNLWEYIYMFAKGQNYQIDPKAIGIPYADKSNIGRYSDVDLRDPGNVWLINYSLTTGKTIKKGHEAPFPIELPYRCIKLAKKIRTVLDPFGGICSTLAAAHYLKLKGFAYEKYPKIDVIKNRILNSQFTPQKQILIPDMEKAIQYLSDLFNKLADIYPLTDLNKFVRSKFSSKKLERLLCILRDFNLESDFLEQISRKLNKERLKSEKLEKFLK
ncbi:MAG: site-specific DNA-methyltransferase [Candidatus Helarchaeota archaeon]|nr:site-specific DNA-methyltransferase [Candidatus Helarchaeota archaeon]